MDFRMTDDETAVAEAGSQVAVAADPWAALQAGGWLDLLVDDPARGMVYLGLVAERLGAGAVSVPLIGTAAVWPTLFAASAAGRRVGVGGGFGLAPGLYEDGAGADVVVALEDGAAAVYETFDAVPAGGLDGDGLAAVTIRGDAAARTTDAGAVAEASRRAAALAAAEMAGAMSQVAEMTTAHVRDRHQFGRPIAKFQAVAHGAAHLAVLAEAARWAARTACGSTEPDATHAAKGWISRAGHEAAAVAHQLHGAIGFTEEYGLQRLTKRLRALRFAWGDDARHHQALGRLRVAASRGA